VHLRRVMRMMRLGLLSAALLGLVAAPAAAAASDTGRDWPDHSAFEALQGDFEDGQAVTRACLECHRDAGHEVRQSIHFTWSFAHPDTGQQTGKRHAINNFAMSVRTNMVGCAKCHAGYGLGDPAYDASADTRADCLVCHDRTGAYGKTHKGRAHITKDQVTVDGEMLLLPDLGDIARHVGPTRIETCGSCHFQAGGGDGAKTGDLDSSLRDAPKALDVHMSDAGADMTCSDCHVERGHELAGGHYDMSAFDPEGTGKPGERRHAASCASCHSNAPHDAAGPYTGHALNRHIDRIACQTCHVPKIARGGVATKTLWDWSEAGRLAEDGSRIQKRNDNGRLVYASSLGKMRWRADYAPSYRWFDGVNRYPTVEDARISDSPPIAINTFGGGPDDPDARLWPFKIMRGKQPYDAGTNRLVPVNLFGDDAAFWTSLDWKPAVRTAMAAVGRDFSGELGFVETRAFYPVTHMVAPAEDALTCRSCHGVGTRMAGVTGTYVPGQSGRWVDVLGLIAVVLAAGGVAGHAGLRLAARRRRAAAGTQTGGDTP